MCGFIFSKMASLSTPDTFIVMIAFAFQRVGLAWRAVADQPEKVAIIWGLGVSLFAHCVMFIGVSYFGQMILAWYLTLGLIGCLPIKRPAVRAASGASPSRNTRRGVPALAPHTPPETSLQRALSRRR